MTDIPANSLYYNPTEIGILKDYMTDTHKDADTIFHEILKDLDDGKYTYTHMGIPIHSNTTVCMTCARFIFGDSLYHYRKNIKESDLRPSVKRPDCHWGKMCRTQNHNVGHAQKFNHICEQTRFS